MGEHVVIPVRRGPNEELRYALRSIATNCPWVDDVTIYGAPPDWFTGRVIPVDQGPNKYENTTRAFETFAADGALPADVVLWNDDFYALRPTDGPPNANLGALADHLARYQARRGPSRYAQGMADTLDLLERWGHETPLAYDLHTPMTLNRGALTETLAHMRHTRIGGTHKRTIYGNVVHLDGPTWGHDVKVYNRNTPIPQGPWASTSDTAWQHHRRHIRRQLPTPSPWERGRP